MSILDSETIKLRERLGKGARYDAASAPATELYWARHGTAYFARKLNELSDDAFDQPTLIAGWSRRRLIAHVGYHARALGRMVESVRTSRPLQSLSEEYEYSEFDSSSLPVRALRNLFRHSATHLNVEWRDLREGWQKKLVVADGRIVSMRELVVERAQVVWLHAVDLDNRGSFRDFPQDFLCWVVEEELHRLQGRGLRLNFIFQSSQCELSVSVDDQGDVIVNGDIAAIARWLLRRGRQKPQPQDLQPLEKLLLSPAPIGEIAS